MCLDILCLVGVCQMEEKLSRLETEYDLQDKITAAYRKLTHDASLSWSIRRSRDQCYRKAYNKVIIHVSCGAVCVVLRCVMSTGTMK